MRKQGEARERSQTDRAPVLEQLEPRLLLDGDLSSSGSLPSFPTPSDGSALIVDLDRRDDVIPEAATPAVGFALGGGTPAPGIMVLGNGVTITDGDTTPSTADGTDFGMVLHGDASISRLFTVRNDGTGDLELGAVGVPVGYSLSEGLSSILAPGASGTFTVRLHTDSAGTKAGDITFTNNDVWYVNPFNFAISGVVTAALVPKITVLGNGVSIADGDRTPSSTDHTDFGNVVQGSAAISRTFTVRNDGTAALALGTVTVPTGFTLTEALSGSLSPGTSDAFTVRLETATVETKTGEISFSTSDCDEDPFNFTITGTITAPVGPEVTVTVAPSAVVEDGATSLVYTIVRSVVGSSPLTVSFGVGGTATYCTDYTQTGAASFSVTSGTVVIAASQTTALVTVDPTADTAVEPDETVILTVILGTGYTVGALAVSTGTIQNDDGAGNLVLGTPATASTSYAGLPAANATDGNAGSRWSSQFSDNEWLYVDLGSAYTISRIVLSWEFAYGRGYKLQVSSDASAWSDVYSTTTGDGGVDDITLATAASGRYLRMLGTQRATMYGYSLWEFEVYGGTPTNHAPAVSSFSKSLMQDTPLPFAAADFTAAFTDPDAGDGLQKIKISSLPTHGVLALNSTAVTLNQEIPVAQIGTLVYAPNSGYTGSDSFQWNGSDGSLYAATEAAVNLSINAAAANLALGKTAAASTSYSGLPPANATDGNTSSRWSSQFSDNERIYVDLGSAYTINRVVLRWETAYGQGYKIQVSSNASSWSDVYTTTTGDGGVDDITLAAPASGRYVRMLGTQRATMYGYSLYEIEVYGGGAVNHAPAVSDISKSLIQDTPLPFAAADFAGAFTDPDAGDGLQKIKITSLPTHGVLALTGVGVTVDREIPVAQIATLVYTPNGGYTGSDNFQWNGSDGSLYAATEAAVNLSINAAVANLALGKTAAASTSYSGLPASNATDGNLNSRWSSQFSDNEWLYVDLGSSYTIKRVVLRWETAYGRGYKIQVSNDAGSWSDVYTTTAGDGGVDDLTLAAPALGRYVRMLGTQRGTEYGYSLYELEVYGGGGSGTPEITVSGNDVSIADGDATPSATDGTDFGSATQGGAAVSETFTVRNDGTAALTLGAVTVPTGFTLTEGLSSSLAPGASDTFTVRLDTATAGAKAGDISFVTNDSDENPFNFRITGTVTAAATNLALGKTAVASTNYTGFPASNVTDGNVSSRWSSQFSDSEWIYVDLGSVFTINRAVLRWEAAYGRGYTIQVSSDASAWSDVYSTTTGDGGMDDITLPLPASGRYVRMLGTQRGTVYGYSLWEFEVWG